MIVTDIEGAVVVSDATVVEIITEGQVRSVNVYRSFQTEHRGQQLPRGYECLLRLVTLLIACQASEINRDRRCAICVSTIQSSFVAMHDMVMHG